MSIITVRKKHKVKYKGDDEDNWVEVERIDEFSIRSGQGATFQEVNYKLRWGDGATEDGDEVINPPDNPTRDMETLTIVDTQDETNRVPIQIIKSLKLHDSGNTIVLHFKNGEDNHRRKTFTQQLTNNDGQSLEVEVVKSFFTGSGQGFTYQGIVHHMNNSEG
jgi:hypothetical protein